MQLFLVKQNIYFDIDWVETRIRGLYWSKDLATKRIEALRNLNNRIFFEVVELYFDGNVDLDY